MDFVHFSVISAVCASLRVQNDPYALCLKLKAPAAQQQSFTQSPLLFCICNPPMSYPCPTACRSGSA